MNSLGVRHVLAAASLAGLCAAAATAQPARDLAALSPEQLLAVEIDSVFGVSRYRQLVTDAPASISVVTAHDIRAFGYRSLADLLAGVRGFHVTDDRNYRYVGVRGFLRPGDYNVRLLVLVDGRRLNEPVYGSVLIGQEFPVDVELIDRVEIIRGPGSAQYGTNAFFAVINILTRAPGVTEGVEAEIDAGSHESIRARGTWNRRFSEALGVVVGGSASRTSGQPALYFPEFATAGGGGGVAVGLDGERAVRGFARISAGRFSLEAAAASRRRALPTAPYGSLFGDPENRTIDRTGFVDGRYEHPIGAQAQLTARGGLGFASYDGWYAYATETDDGSGPEGRVVNRDESSSASVDAELVLSTRVAAGHHLTAGVEFWRHLMLIQRNYDLPIDVPYLDDRRRGWTGAGFVQVDSALRPWLSVSGGVRLDAGDQLGPTASPRLGVIVRPHPSTALKVLAGRAFRAPSVFERFYADSFSSKVPDALAPERVTTVEVVAEQYIGHHLRLSASGFDSVLSGLIDQWLDPDDALLVFRNLNRVRARGLELEGEARWSSGVRLRTSYTRQAVEDRDSGLSLSNAPLQMASCQAVAPIPGTPLVAGIEALHVGRRLSKSGQPVAGRTLTHATMTTPLGGGRVSLRLSIRNVFGVQHADPAGPEHLQTVIPQDGRTAQVSLGIRF